MTPKHQMNAEEMAREVADLTTIVDVKIPLSVLIVEDEQPAATRLRKLLAKLPAYEIEVLAILDSVRSVEKWLQDNLPPAVIFMDIHLADGTAFDLLKRVDPGCPLIFTTAYNQYSLDAFKTDGIDYLIKPVKAADLQQALTKLIRFSTLFGPAIPKDAPLETPDGQGYKQRFIVRYGEHIRSLNVQDVAYFYSANKATCARTVSGYTYPIDYNLDALEVLLNPMDFFRLNRQCLTHIQAISEMRTYSKGRVFVSLDPVAPESLIVSSEKSAKFKRWLGGEL